VSAIESARSRPVAHVVDVKSKPLVPIKAWAAFGGLWVGFILYIWGKWLLGPYAAPVETGPSAPPTWMSVGLVIWQIVTTAGMLGFFYWFLVRPWVRERRLTTDGILCVAGFFLWFQDPLSNYFSPWITYNSRLVNVGSWVNGIPGWLSFGEPGRQLPEPFLLEPGVYVTLWLSVAALGCAIMRRTKARWPHFGPYRLLLVCFVALAFFDLLLEGLLMMPMGLFTYVGGAFPILFPNSYHTFPLHEPVFTSLMFTGVAALRYFKDDRGYTFVERGAEQIQGPKRQGLYRMLAIIGATQLCMFVFYNVPSAIMVATHGRVWPVDAQERSYLTDFICGDGTDRACPGPGIPLSKQDRSARVTPNGTLSVPPGTVLPPLVPFDRGAYHGSR
jgi:Spirocyclase AveC-like